MARIAPSWIRIAKLFQKLSSPRLKKRSASNRWPVEETGRNSVMPSTMPRITARIASDIMIRVRYDRKEPKKPGSSRLFVSMLQSQKNGKTLVASRACWAIAFSSEVDTGARKENASKQRLGCSDSIDAALRG